MRLCVTGGPRAGKTTLASVLSLPVLHTDDLIGSGLTWSEQSREVSRWMRAPAPWAIEGVAVPRALRKALAASDEKPCDRVLFLTVAHVPTTTRQDGMAQSVLTVFEQIVPELIARGVIVEFK